MQISPTSQGNFSALTSNPSRRADGSQADAPLLYSNQEWLNTEAGKAPGPPHSECIADKRHKWMFAPAANLLFTIRLCPSPT